MSTPWRLDAGQIEVLDDAMVEVLKAKTPAERVAMIGSCNRTMRQMIRAHLRAKYPNWTDAEVDAALARRMSLGAA